MKKSKFSEEQISYASRQAEAGTPVPDLCRQLGCSEASFYLWKKRYGKLGVAELGEMRQLRDENARLKRLVVDLSLDKHAHIDSQSTAMPNVSCHQLLNVAHCEAQRSGRQF